MDLLKEFQQYIKQQDLFHPKDKLLLAVSGGVDSVVLCELCKRSGYDFVIAHCNFQLRGEESERDEEFVKELGKKYGVEVLVKKLDTANYANEMKIGIQEAARKLRYKWFFEIFAEKNLVPGSGRPAGTPGWHTTIDPSGSMWYLATAHHLNDNVETILMNFFKGTGIKGLKGILPKQKFLSVSPYLLRPMLFASKEDIVHYAKENNVAWVEDASNSSDTYTRNYFRNKLIPALKEVFPEVENNLADNSSRFKEIGVLYEQALALHKKNLVVEKGNEVHIPVFKLLKTEPLATVVYEIFGQYNFSSQQAGEIIRLLNAESGKYIESESHRVLKNRNWLIISLSGASAAAHIVIEEKDKQAAFENGVINLKRIKTTNHKLQTKNNIAELDASGIKFPLLLRKWKQGDYFYPLGMRKKKKLSRFFIDQKLPLTKKEKTWVIEMDKKIVWVVGMRIDDRFKITDKTKDILQVSVSVAE